MMAVALDQPLAAMQERFEPTGSLRRSRVELTRTICSARFDDALRHLKHRRYSTAVLRDQK
jgi:hypothetical protein